jgi:diaminopimelate decarboxylase
LSAAASGWQHLDPRVFSRNAARNAAGELEVSGVSASSLLAEFGSPLYVIDEQDARDRAAEALEAFTREFARIGTRAKVYYAGKAQLNIEIARWMVEIGLGVDVATGGELAVALAAHVEPARIGMHGNNKSDAELEVAVSVGVGSLIVDSAEEVERLAVIAERLGRVQAVFLRVNSGVHASTHDFLATSHEDQKFGVALEDAAGIVASIRSSHSLAFLGLHCHIGSQIFGTSGFTESARRLLALTAELRELGDVPELNLGGGFGIAYTSDDDPMPIDQIAAELANIVRDTAAELNTPLPIVSFEPGRAIIGAAGLTLYSVGTIKPVALSDGGSRTYVSVDGGMSDNIRTALYEANYTARLANRESGAQPVLVRVVGKHCESGDIVVDSEYLPADVHRGDTLVVAATGAYCWSLASNYNYVPRPAVVAVRDGVARVIVRGETESDLVARNVDWSDS